MITLNVSSETLQECYPYNNYALKTDKSPFLLLCTPEKKSHIMQTGEVSKAIPIGKLKEDAFHMVKLS